MSTKNKSNMLTLLLEIPRAFIIRPQAVALSHDYGHVRPTGRNLQLVEGIVNFAIHPA